MKQTSASHPLQPAAAHSLQKSIFTRGLHRSPYAIGRAVQTWLRGTLCKTAPACQRMPASPVWPRWAAPTAAGANPRGRHGYAKVFVQILGFTLCLIFKYGVGDPYLCWNVFCSCSSFFIPIANVPRSVLYTLCTAFISRASSYTRSLALTILLPQLLGGCSLISCATCGQDGALYYLYQQDSSTRKYRHTTCLERYAQQS